MRSITIVIFALLFVKCEVKAQIYSHSVKPQREIKATVSVPIFLDSLKFINDIKELNVIKDIFFKLKKSKVGNLGLYSFYVKKDGKIVLDRNENRALFYELNKFVKNKFLKYKWLPSHRLDCLRCFVRTNGVLYFDFDTDNNQVIFVITINNEKEYKVFNEKIIIEI